MTEKEFSFYSLFVPLTNKKVTVFLFVIGLVVFGNSFFNPFIFDDIPQIIQNVSIHTIYSIPSLFVTSISLPHTSFPLFHMYYKPLLFSFYAIFWTIFQGNPFGFHVIQTLLHITNSVLVFFLFTKFFKKPLGFLLSLAFLLHPMQSETVIYAANLQDVLFVFFGLLTINIWLQIKQNSKPLPLTLVTSLLLLLSLFSKETGILFCLMTIVYCFLFQKAKIKQIIFAVGITSILYLLFRIVASFLPTSTLTLSLMQKLPLSERMVSIPKIVWYYFSTFFLPLHLATGQAWIIKQTSFADFWLPLISDIVFFLGIAVIGFCVIKLQRKRFPIFFFFIIWFLIGLLFHIQLFPLDLTVADRWFYFSSIGFLGILGTAAQIGLSKVSNLQKIILVSCIVCILIMLSILTIMRNAQWQSPFALYSHDIVYAKDNPVFLSYYSGLLMEHGEYYKAKPYLEKSLQLDPSLGSNEINLGVWEEHANDFDKAKQIYGSMINNPNISLSFKQLAYENLSRVLLFKMKNTDQAKHVVQTGLQQYPHDIYLTEYLAVILYEEKNKLQAENILVTFLKTQPNQQMHALLQTMQNNSFQLPK